MSEKKAMETSREVELLERLEADAILNMEHDFSSLVDEFANPGELPTIEHLMLLKSKFALAYRDLESRISITSLIQAEKTWKLFLRDATDISDKDFHPDIWELACSGDGNGTVAQVLLSFWLMGYEMGYEANTFLPAESKARIKDRLSSYLAARKVKADKQ